MANMCNNYDVLLLVKLPVAEARIFLPLLHIAITSSGGLIDLLCELISPNCSAYGMGRAGRGQVGTVGLRLALLPVQ